MVFGLTAASPATVFENGGYLIEIQGTTFDPSHGFNVHIGPLGSASDPICYSGVPEQGNTIYPWTVAKLRVYTPLLDLAPVSLKHDIYVIDTDTAENHTLAFEMEVTNRDFKSGTFAIRKVLPPHWRTGPRDIDLVPPT